MLQMSSISGSSIICILLRTTLVKLHHKNLALILPTKYTYDTVKNEAFKRKSRAVLIQELHGL